MKTKLKYFSEYLVETQMFLLIADNNSQQCFFDRYVKLILK